VVVLSAAPRGSRIEKSSKENEMNLFHKVTFIMILVCCVWLDKAGAQEQPLKVRLSAFPPKIRSSAPFLMNFQIDYSGDALIQGDLILTVKNGNDVLYTYSIPGIAVTTGQQSYQFLMPPLNQGYSDQLDVGAVIVGKKGSYSLGSTSITKDQPGMRVVVVAMSSRSSRLSEEEKMIQALLRQERMMPDEPQLTRALSTVPALIRPEEIPVSPMSFCAFDGLVLSGEGFTDLKPAQMMAIRQWVLAGGKLVVYPKGPGKQAQADFLNDILKGVPNAPVVTVDSTGVLSMAGVENILPFSVYRTGLGRLLWVTSLPQTEPEMTSEMGESLLKFWNIRKSQWESTKASGLWNLDLQVIPDKHKNQFVYQQNNPNGILGKVTSFLPGPILNGSTIVNTLMPAKVQVVPFWIIVTLLTSFVMVIGPIDYYILGYFKMRRYTWVFFPVVSLIFAIGTILISNHYLGRDNSHRRIIVRDSSPSGVVVREVTIDNYFAGTSMMLQRKEEGVIVAEISPNALRIDYNYNMRGNNQPGLLSSPGTYLGRFPSRYQYELGLKQWSPQALRTIKIIKDPVQSPFKWQSLDLAALEDHTSEQLIKKLGLPSGFLGTVTVMHSGNSLVVYQNDQPIDQTIVESLTTHLQSGYFSIMSSISPNGSAQLEDVQILDQTDPNQWVIIIAEKSGVDVVMHRCLYEF